METPPGLQIKIGLVHPSLTAFSFDYNVGWCVYCISVYDYASAVSPISMYVSIRGVLQLYYGTHLFD